MSFRRRSPLALLLVVALVVGTSACGDDDLTPEEARRQRVEERLKLSYTDEQVDCMLDQFSEGVLVSLDGEGNMPQAGAELEEFTGVARSCVIGSGDTLPGTPEGDDTTTSSSAPAEGSSPGGSGPDTTAGSPEATAAPSGGPTDTRPETEAPAGGADEGEGDGDGDGDAQATADPAG